ncbi:MAG: glycosyltransferase family 2 protein [Bacteroidales bacterium]|nr:glycosyltransferase family 2 protein [Bacteroidales bacterium]
MDINLTIIIPHKNSIELLKRCVSSIPDNDDIQVIVVDDYSSASIQTIRDAIGGQRHNVSCISNDGHPYAGGARNCGLRYAKGKWILFSDADDFFVDDAFKIISSHFNDSVEIVYFLSERRYSDTLEVFDSSCLGLNNLVRSYNGSELTENKLKYGVCVPWGRMFRRSLIEENNIRFDETRYANDTMFSTRTAFFSKSIATDINVIYCFTANKGSLTHTLTKESIECRYIVSIKRNLFLESIGLKDLKTEVVHHIYHSLKFGLRFTFSLLRKGMHYKINPFDGFFKWIIEHYKNSSLRDNIKDKE